MSVAVGLFLEWVQCSSIDRTQLNPSLRPASVQQWWLTAECSDGAAFFMNKLACHRLLHQLLHLPSTNTVYSVWSVTLYHVPVCVRVRQTAGGACEVTGTKKTERRFTLTLLRLTHLSEQHLGRVTMQLNHFPGYRYCTIIMSGSFQKYPANTMKYVFHYSIAPPIAPTLVHVPYRQYHFRPAPLWFSLSSLAQTTITPFMIGSRAVSMLNSGAKGPGFKLQPRRCRVTVLGKLLTPTVPLFTKQQNW